ncbi:MAG: hypothetical protein LAT84_12395 [Balneolia bacterium]|nr:hypothetical protein [Balneolia bacterium]
MKKPLAERSRSQNGGGATIEARFPLVPFDSACLAPLCQTGSGNGRGGNHTHQAKKNYCLRLCLPKP